MVVGFDVYKTHRQKKAIKCKEKTCCHCDNRKNSKMDTTQAIPVGPTELYNVEEQFGVRYITRQRDLCARGVR